MRFCLTAVGVLALAAAPFAAALAAPDAVPAEPTANLPIQRVTLYTSGVGYFERNGYVDGDATQTLLFPTGQINDVLKSLVMLDSGGGSIQPVTYAAQDPLARQLQNFSVDLADNPDRATLLNRLRGTSVTATTAQGTVTGTIVGVETQTVTLPDNGGTTQQSTLNLSADDGLHAIPLAQVTTLKINDPAVNSELAQALTVVAQGRDANKRPVTLSFDGQGRREVTVGYLTETPLWQTTYRLVLGKSPILQAWALVQNTSQDDWNGVHLTLVSGQPISFIQDLYTPQYVPRPLVAPRITASPTPQTYASNLDQTPAEANNAPIASASPVPIHGGSGGYGGMMGGMGGMTVNGGTAYGFGAGGFGGAPLNSTDNLNRSVTTNGALENGLPFGQAAAKSIATSGAKLGTALFSYAIKVPVSVPRGQSAMIPFFSGAIQAQPVAIYDPEVQPDHPLSGARIKNTSGLHLMGGPLTVFDTGGNGGGYVGDALIDDTEPGETRLISYALDLAVDAHSENGPGSGQLVSITIVQGILHLKSLQEQTTIYTLKNNSAEAQTVVVEHPYQGADWTLLEPKKATERTATLLRFDVPLPAGASKKFLVREQHPNFDAVTLIDADTSTVLGYSNENLASPAVKAALQEIILRRRTMADTQAQIENLNTRLQAIGQDQTRIRDNMKALDRNSPLYKRYVSELNTQETTLTMLQTQIDTLQAQLAQQKAALNDFVAHLNAD